MKRIVVSSLHPLISRNILQTGLVKRLRAAGAAVFIFCPSYKKHYFTEKFSGPGVEIIPCDETTPSAGEVVVREISNGLLRTSTIQLNRRERLFKNGGRIGYIFFFILNNFCARSKVAVRFFRFLYRKVLRTAVYDKRLQMIKPDLVFCTDIFNDEDSRLMLSAKKNNCPCVGMVRSWDNTTNKGILPLIPSMIVVHNKIIGQELVDFHGVSIDHVVVSGIPQFDFYFGYSPATTELFYSRTGFDPGKKIILFAPTGKKFVDDDWYLLQILIDGIVSGQISGHPQVLVRCPPGDEVDLTPVKFSSLVKVFIDRPGIGFSLAKIKDRELDNEAMYWLADTLFFSDLLISVGSTLCIDMSVFDKPVICPQISLAGLVYFRSMVKMYDKYHYQYLIRTGGCRLVTSPTQYLATIQHYLDNPKSDSIGRKILLEQQCTYSDGRSSHRLARTIIDFLTTQRPNDDG
ncbi:MAG: CDP-glycerol glycerophosphotransferase family protein [Patescibacteria group bacterium]